MEDENIIEILSSRAILEFEDVKAKCKEYFEKSTKEEQKRKRLESQFKQLKQVSLLAVAEYESLHKQYVTENKYREEVEQKLRKVTEENKEIRKLNKLGSNTTIIPANDGNNTSQGTKGELEVLRAMKDAVNNELRNAKNELNIAKEALQQEKSAHGVTMNRLTIGVQQINQLNRVSVLAIDEFSNLRKKFDVEVDCRIKAEDVATDLTVKHELQARKSRIINEEEESQLTKFMEEIEAINAQAEKERKEYDRKIKELEEQLEDSTNTENIKATEEKLSLLMEQLDISQKQLVVTEERATKSENDCRTLYTRLALAEREISSSSMSSLPPPPPPPPPPIAAPVIRKFIFKIGRKNKGGALPEQEDDPVFTAMADMIDRIKKGVKLRPVAPTGGTKEGDQDSGAMGELAGLLTNLRQGRLGQNESLDASEPGKEPEFARFKLKKTNSVQSSTDKDDGVSGELKRKLEKQKSVADGIQEESVPCEPKIENDKSSEKVVQEELETKPDTSVEKDIKTDIKTDENEERSHDKIVDTTAEKEPSCSSYEIITAISPSTPTEDNTLNIIDDTDTAEQQDVKEAVKAPTCDSGLYEEVGPGAQVHQTPPSSADATPDN